MRIYYYIILIFCKLWLIFQKNSDTLLWSKVIRIKKNNKKLIFCGVLHYLCIVYKKTQ